MENQRHYCTFFLNGQMFGVEAKKVQEVLLYQEMTPVPLVCSVIKGLINLRGEIVTALDLRTRLEMPERKQNKQPMNVVVRDNEDIYSFIVDEIGDILDVSEKDFEETPDTVKGVGRELIKGAYKLEDRLLLIFDVRRIVDFRSDKDTIRILN